MQPNNNSVNIWEQVQKFISENTAVTITIPLAVIVTLFCGYTAFSNSKPQSTSVPTVTPTLGGQPAPSLPPSVNKNVSGVNIEGGISGQVGDINNSPNNSTNTNSNNNNSPNNSNNINSHNSNSTINSNNSNSNIGEQSFKPVSPANNSHK